MTRILLAYSPSNADLATAFIADMSKVGLPVDTITFLPDDAVGDFAARLSQQEDPVILLVTDNLLRNAHTMSGLLESAQYLHQHRLLLPVLADGKDDHGQAVPTHIDRMVHALQYMNYWQKDWLNLSDQHQHASPEQKATLVTNLDVHRTIANQVGDLIGLLREAGTIEWPSFQQNGYAAFFRRFGLNEWHDQYLRHQEEERSPAPPPHTVAETIAPALPPKPIQEDHPLAPIPALDFLIPVPMPDDTSLPEGATLQHEDTPDHTHTEALEEAPPTRVAPQEQPISASADHDDLPDALISEPTPLPDNDVAAMIHDAWFWLKQGHEDRAMELFEAALDLYPEHEGLRQEYRKAQDELTARQAAVLPPSPSPASPVSQASSSEQEARSYELMGDMAAEKGDYLFAKYCWDRSAEIGPLLPGLFRKLGLMTYEHLRDYKETALVYLQKALDHQPDDPDVLLAMADNAAQSGQPDEAAQFYSRAISHAPHLRTPDRERLFLKNIPPAAPEAQPVPVPVPTPSLQMEQRQASVASQLAGSRSEVLTVLITGATSGIGRATAEVFARHGHRLLLTGRRTDRLSQINRELQERYDADVLLLPFDVRDRDTVQHIFDALPAAWKDIDVLLNNAGLAKGLAPVHEADMEHWETMIDTNLKGLLYVTRAVAPGMVRRRRGHIINISSSAGKEAYAQGSVYCATKFAVEALTRSMRLDLHKHNIRVSQVSPGHVEETEFAVTRFDGDQERARIYEDFQPLKASDVAEAIYFIATRPPHVNIQDIWMFGTQQASATVIDRSGRPSSMREEA